MRKCFAGIIDVIFICVYSQIQWQSAYVYVTPKLLYEYNTNFVKRLVCVSISFNVNIANILSYVAVKRYAKTAPVICLLKANL